MDTPTPHRDRTLRLITLLTFLPALALLIPHAASAHEPLPVLTLIPHFFSSLLGLTVLILLRPASSFYDADNPKRLRLLRMLTSVSDVVLVCTFLGLLVPTWALLRERRGRRYDGRYGWWRGEDRGLVMLACYGSVPGMVNLGIHTFLTLRTLHTHLRTRLHRLRTRRTPAKCPHCNHSIPTTSSIFSSSTPHAGRVTFTRDSSRIIPHDTSKYSLLAHDYEYDEDVTPGVTPRVSLEQGEEGGSLVGKERFEDADGEGEGVGMGMGGRGGSRARGEGEVDDGKVLRGMEGKVEMSGAGVGIGSVGKKSVGSGSEGSLV